MSARIVDINDHGTFYLEIVELRLVRAPHRVIETVVIRDQSQSLVSVVGVDVLPDTSFPILIGTSAIQAFGDSLYKSQRRR